ncbi:alkaline phosphatase family protein [Halobaculum litoreum]|uniref:Alkaline phosphatase family protein n=1 Tax=Halobaculum litoreum TaxID=3031998 RepID=A0ABD5XY93_9EURY
MSGNTTQHDGDVDRTATPERAFVLGLDGVPWNLLEDWIEAGELENFARLAEEGAAGPLESTVPPSTPLAWPSIATGTRSDKHGVYGFKTLSSNYKQRMYTSEDILQPELWDLLSPALVGNVPMTYPAREISGQLVTGMLSPSMNDRFTYPPELRDEIAESIPDYKIGLSWSEYEDREDEFLEDLTALVEARRELLRRFMREDDWRLLFFVFTSPDRLQHLVWNNDTLLSHYKLLDEILGEVLDYVARRDAVLYVVSDHGFGPISKFVYVNRVLEEHGYLVREDESGTRGLLSRLGVSKDGVQSTMASLGISQETVQSILPESVVNTVAQQVPGTHEIYDIDHSETKAFVIGSGTVYVNDEARFEQGIVDPADIPAVKREIRSVFESVTDPETGERVLDVWDGDGVFPTDERGPDLVVRGRDGYQKATSLTERVIAPSGAMVGGHHSEGIVLAWGPSIQPGSMPTDATVFGVAPTLLHSLGEPVRPEMDGRVLTELFHPESAAATRPVESREYEAAASAGPAEDEEDYGEVEDRLRGLGYME